MFPPKIDPGFEYVAMIGLIFFGIMAGPAVAILV
jgi:hypothetical protein